MVETLRRLLHPGRRIDLIVTMDPEEGGSDIRPVLIHDVNPEKGRMQVSQSDPPLTSRGGEIVGSIVEDLIDSDSGTAGCVRFGFHSTVISLSTRYLLKGGLETDCCTISFPHDIYELNLRSAFRVWPHHSKKISASAVGPKQMPSMPARVSVVNISRRGIQISWKEWEGLIAEPGDTVLLDLSLSNGQMASFIGRVVWGRRHRREKSIWLMGLEFVSPGAREENFLNDYIVGLERFELRRRSGLE